MKILMRADTHVHLDIPETTPAAKCTISQVIAALSVSLVSMMVGYTSAYTSPALVSMNSTDSTLQITANEGSWVSGIMPLFALVGGALGGLLIEYMGRKMTIISTAVLFIISWTLIAAATNVWFLLSGRSVAGLAVGVASLALPVYLGETIQPEVRGTLGLLPTALGNIGILVCFVVGNYLPWNWLAVVGMAPVVPFIGLAFLIPETPRWYISKGSDSKAMASLQWLRGATTNIDDEYNELKKSQIEADKLTNSSAFRDLFQRPNYKPLLISLGLMLFQQFSGINAVIFYTVTIFQQAGSTIDENLCTIIVGAVNFLSTFVATVLIDRLGRKVLLYISNVLMIITLMTLGTFFYLRHMQVDVQDFGWLPLVSFVLFVIGFSLGFGPIPWLMMGEILPAKVRGSAASVVTGFNWACTFLVTKTFVDITEVIGSYGAFWLFGSVCVVGMVFIKLCVPETQGQSLEDIEKKMTNMKVRRMSSRANMKPLPTL